MTRLLILPDDALQTITNTLGSDFSCKALMLLVAFSNFYLFSKRPSPPLSSLGELELWLYPERMIQT